MPGVWQDLRFGFRQFAKSPTLTAVAVLSLALGIGASSTIFSVMNAFIYRPLPWERWVTMSWRWSFVRD
jgi:putative ABC transport system permease protein